MDFGYYGRNYDGSSPPVNNVPGPEKPKPVGSPIRGPKPIDGPSYGN